LQNGDRHKAELRHKYDLRRIKRSTNFEKFRKEVRNLIKTHYSVKMEHHNRELEETKGQLKYALKQLKSLGYTAEKM
jgi:hypothetical protein